MRDTIYFWSKRLVPYILPLVVLSGMVIYFFNNLDQFKRLTITSWWWCGALVIAFAVHTIPSALLVRKLLQIFQVKLSFWEAVGLVFLSGMGNYLAPYVGGWGLKAAYLKSRHKFPLSYFASIVGGTALLSLSINALLGLMVLVYLVMAKGVFNLIIFILLLAPLLLTGIIIFLPAGQIKSQNRFLVKINRIWEGWKKLSEKPRDLAILAFLTFLIAVLGVICLYIAFRVVSENISPANAIIISALTALSQLMQIAPAGLGISELVIIFTSRALGEVMVIGVSVAIIRRAVATVVILVGGGIASIALSRSLVHSSPSARKG